MILCTNTLDDGSINGCGVGTGWSGTITFQHYNQRSEIITLTRSIMGIVYHEYQKQIFQMVLVEVVHERHVAY
jgi:hypothetical protein